MHRTNTIGFNTINFRANHTRSTILRAYGARQAAPSGKTTPRRQGSHTKHIIKSVSVAKKLEVLSFWANGPLPKMRSTTEHFWHDLAPEFYHSKRMMIQRWRREQKKLEILSLWTLVRPVQELSPVSGLVTLVNERQERSETILMDAFSGLKGVLML
ncbi:hypothetical protein DVH05_013752 [Phytophthora capsici]|nr:hypothetical protein DVH05_013752 [Phytophthora capsici]